MAATAASTHFIPVGEYLGSVYRPDVDYVDGLLDERNVGEIDHAALQKILLFALTAFEETHNVYAVQETRTQTQPTRFRIPDVCLIPADRIPERIITKPPLLCVEVLSPRDSVGSMRARCMDYIRMGVPEVWIFDPQDETAYWMQGELFSEVHEGILRLGDTGIELDVQEMFARARKRTNRSPR